MWYKLQLLKPACYPGHSGRFVFLACHLEMALSSPGWPRTYYVAENDTEFEIYLLLPLKCWDYRYAPHSRFHAAGNWNPELHAR